MTKTQQAVQDLVNKHSKLHGDFERFGQIGAWERCEELFDAIMELAPIELAELAASAPNLRLAVVDLNTASSYPRLWDGRRESLRYNVVKMEEK